MTRALGALVVLVTIACFLPTLANDFVDWDDHVHFRDNAFYRGLSPSHLGWMFTSFEIGGHYQPLSWVSFGLDYTLWGLEPSGYHLTSTLLHGMNALLVFQLALALLRRTGQGDGASRPWAAAAGALFYGLHPLRVEPVAWATDRGNVLACSFLLLTCLAYLRMEAERRTGRPGTRWLLLSLAACSASLLARPWAITLPAVLIVLDFLVLRRVALVEKIPFAVLALLFMLVSLAAKNYSASLVTGSTIPHGLVERILQAGYGLCFYPWKTLAPLGLSPLYPLERQLVSPSLLFWAAPPVALALTGCCFALRRRWPGILAAWLTSALLVSPVLGFAQAGPQLAADRYTYVSGVPWALLLAAVLARVGVHRARAPALALGVALGLALLGVFSVRQIGVWRSSVTLWERAAAIHPRSSSIHFYRGNTRQAAGDLDAAITDYTLALELGVPDRADAYNNRSAALRMRGRAGDASRALADIDASIRLKPVARAYFNRGLLRETSDLQRAIDDWNRALRLQPDFAAAYRSRGIAQQRLGNSAAAAADYRRALTHADPLWPLRADVEERLRALQR